MSSLYCDVLSIQGAVMPKLNGNYRQCKDDASEELEETEFSSCLDSIGEPETSKRLSEYCGLIQKSNRTEEEDDRLQEILDQALLDNSLSFWLLVADSILSSRQGYLNKSCLKSYRAASEVLNQEFLNIRKAIELEDASSLSDKMKLYLTHRGKVRLKKQNPDQVPT